MPAMPKRPHAPRSAWWLLMIPLALLVYGVELEASLGPSRVETADPGYYYLFDALNLVEGHPVVHIEHPGTPVQALGAAAIRAVYAVSGSGGVVHDLIARPGKYIVAFYFTLLTLYALAWLLLGYVAWRTTGDVGRAVALQALPVPLLLGCLLPVTVETLLVTAVALLCIALFGEVEPRKRSAWSAPVYGALVGFGMAVKLTFAPLALIPLLVLRTARELAWFGVATVISFVLSTAPIWSQYPRLPGWVAGVAARDGMRRFDSGAAGLPSLSTWLAHLAELIAIDPLSTALLIAAAAIALRALVTSSRDRTPWPSSDRLVAGLVLCSIVDLLLVANQPDGHYLVPVVATRGLLLWLVIARAPTAFRWATERRLLGAGIVIAAVAVLARPVALAVGSVTPRAAAAAIQHQLDTAYADTPKVLYRGASSVAYNLQQGNWLSGGYYTDALAAQYPRLLFYDGEGAGLCDWRGQPTDAATDGRVTRKVFVGGRLSETGQGQYGSLLRGDGLWRPPPLPLREIFHAGDEAIYESSE